MGGQYWNMVDPQWNCQKWFGSGDNKNMKKIRLCWYIPIHLYSDFFLGIFLFFVKKIRLSWWGWMGRGHCQPDTYFRLTVMMMIGYMYISRIKGDTYCYTDMVRKWEWGRRIPPNPKLLLRQKFVCKWWRGEGWGVQFVTFFWQKKRRFWSKTTFVSAIVCF